jgi:hypothetical protein
MREDRAVTLRLCLHLRPSVPLVSLSLGAISFYSMTDRRVDARSQQVVVHHVAMLCAFGWEIYSGGGRR